MAITGASRVVLPVLLLLAAGCNNDDGREVATTYTTLGGDGDGDGDGEDPAGEGEFIAPRIRILLGRQYLNAIGDLLGPNAAQQASVRADVTLNGFDSIGASQISLTNTDIDTYESSAVAVAAAAIADPSALAPYRSCTPTMPTDVECMRSFVAEFGFVAWRRPLDDIEVGRWANVGLTAAADFGSFDKGLEFVVAGMLQSPNFIYQIEVGTATTDGSGQRKLSGYEMASRLAFFLLDTAPSVELLEAAAAGELDSADGVRAWAEQLILDPRSRAAFGNFFEEVLYLRKLKEVAKDLGTYPGWSPYLAESMKVETIALIDDIVWIKDGDFRDILDAEYTFVNQALADHYGVVYPGPSGFQQVPVPPGEKRGGIFGHASMLSVLAHVSSSSPTIRGKFIQERMLCYPIPPPPPGVVTDLPPASEGAQTMRERLAEHVENDVCAGCHLIMDPPGLGLENYDGVGRFRTLDNGAPIDAASDLDGEPFEGALELGRILRERPRFSYCTVLNLYRHASGHVETPGELAHLMDVDESFADAEYRFKAALVELVGSRAFRYVGEQD